MSSIGRLCGVARFEPVVLDHPAPAAPATPEPPASVGPGAPARRPRPAVAASAVRGT